MAFGVKIVIIVVGVVIVIEGIPLFTTLFIAGAWDKLQEKINEFADKFKKNNYEYNKKEP